MINRRRHQQPADASSPDADSRRRANNASIDSASVDEEAGKGKKYQDDLFRSIYTALGLRRSNPLSSSGRRRRVSSSLFVLLIVCAILYWPSPRLNRHFERYQKRPTLVMLFDSSYGNAVGDWGYRGSQSRTLYSSSLEPLELSDIPPMYGDITFSSLRSASKFQRRVSPNDYAAYEAIRRQTFERKERKDHTDIYFQHHEETLSLKCQRQNWQDLSFPNCNAFHEFSMDRGVILKAHGVQPLGDFKSALISNGSFRDAWMLKHVSTDENVILKTMRAKREVDVERMKEMQRDAIIMERLTSSPRIVDIFGYCGTSSIVETLPYELEEYIVPGDGMAKQKDLDQYDDVHPMNHYTIEEKLYIALKMAESIADLHGFEGGVIVHDDVQLCQWLVDPQGNIKLGDFNRGEMMEWNERKKAYCKHENGYVNGNYRSPEEMRDDYLDEKIDVYSFGNNIYALLTGLWVFYENDDDETTQNQVVKGERAYVDVRYRNHSFIEGKLVEIMERCWIHDPDERADIFEAVRFLRGVRDEVKKRQAEGDIQARSESNSSLH